MGIWVHPSTVIIPAQVGGKWWKFGVLLSPIDVVVSWLKLWTPTDCIPHLSWMYYAKCFCTFICCGYGRMGAPLHCHTCGRRRGLILAKILYDWAQVMLWCHGWCCKPTPTSSVVRIPLSKGIFSQDCHFEGRKIQFLHSFLCSCPPKTDKIPVTFLSMFQRNRIIFLWKICNRNGKTRYTEDSCRAYQARAATPNS